MAIFSRRLVTEKANSTFRFFGRRRHQLTHGSYEMANRIVMPGVFSPSRDILRPPQPEA